MASPILSIAVSNGRVVGDCWSEKRAKEVVVSLFVVLSWHLRKELTRICRQNLQPIYSMSQPISRTSVWEALLFLKIVWPCIVTDSLWVKPTNALNSSFIGIMTVHVSGSLSANHQEFLAVHRLWYILCSCDDRFLPEVGWNCSSILLLAANGHHNCIKCTKADVRLRTPDDWQKGCPRHVES